MSIGIAWQPWILLSWSYTHIFPNNELCNLRPSPALSWSGSWETVSNSPFLTGYNPGTKNNGAVQLEPALDVSCEWALGRNQLLIILFLFMMGYAYNENQIHCRKGHVQWTKTYKTNLYIKTKQKTHPHTTPRKHSSVSWAHKMKPQAVTRAFFFSSSIYIFHFALSKNLCYIPIWEATGSISVTHKSKLTHTPLYLTCPCQQPLANHGLLVFFKRFIYVYMCIWVFLLYVHTRLQGSQRRLLDPLGLKLQMVVSSEFQLWSFATATSTLSYLCTLSYLSSPY